DPGVRVDMPALAFGTLAIGVCLVSVIALTARGSARTVPDDDPARHIRPSRAAAALDRANAPVSIVGGTRFALGRGGVHRASPAVSVFGLVAAAAATAAALVFGTNLAELTTPRHYGQTWDAEVTWNGTSLLSPSAANEKLVRHAVERGLTLGTFDDVKFGD